MKRTLETRDEKIEKICDILRKETIEPAKSEAEKIINAAKEKAEEIIREARANSEEILAEAQRAIEQKNNVFQSSLEQAAKQSLETLRQSIELKLFNEEFYPLITRHTANPQVIANLINALIKAIEKDGLSVNLTAFIPATLSVDEVNRLLGEQTLKKLKEKSVVLGNFSGGVKIRLNDKKVTLDITDAELAELLRRFVRKDFRKLLFADT